MECWVHQYNHASVLIRAERSGHHYDLLLVMVEAADLLISIVINSFRRVSDLRMVHEPYLVIPCVAGNRLVGMCWHVEQNRDQAK